MKLYSRLFLLYAVAFFLLTQGCGLGGSFIDANENISADLRKQMQANNSRCVSALQENNVRMVEAMCSKELLEKHVGLLPQIIKGFSSQYSAGKYRVWDEYYIRSSVVGLSHTLRSPQRAKDNYSLRYKAVSKDMYLSLIIVENAYGEALVTLFYGKYGEEWKINSLRIDQYSYFGLTGSDYYEKAKNAYAASHLVDAVNYASIADACINQLSEWWTYDHQEEFTGFYQKISQEVKEKFRFPIFIGDISTYPEIQSVRVEMLKEGFYPVVSYLTQIRLEDTIALKNENMQLQQKIGTIFPGIDKNKGYVLYEAVDHLPPSPGEEVPAYRFTQTIEE